jgi:hypothetical protein
MGEYTFHQCDSCHSFTKYGTMDSTGVGVDTQSINQRKR